MRLDSRIAYFTCMKLQLLSLLFILVARSASAWIYPEHRYIALLAIQRMSPERRSVLEKLWLEARVGYTDRLTESIIVPDQGIHPTQLDYASWAGISGDHSCSPVDMLNSVLKSDWILEVADIAAQLERNIKKSKNRSQHINAIRDSDIRLQRADAEYATRAGSNNVHFLLARAEVDTDGADYLKATLTPGVEINAIGAYSWFHVSAMFKAARYAQGNLSESEKSALILGALADEAFALHFLEDVFASGHTAGTWGVASVRKGTHDYYNEEGLEVVTWDGKRRISLGDAFMRTEDAEFAATSVTLSLVQLVKAASGEWSLAFEDDKYAQNNSPDTLNVCRNNFMPPLRRDQPIPEGKMGPAGFLPEVLKTTPVPGLATGLGEIPRFRSELGMFYGLSTAVNTFGMQTGFGKDQNNPGAVGGLEANLRFGLGLDGVLNQAGDGLVFVQLGYRQDASSSSQFRDSYSAVPAGAITAAVPARGAYNLRVRMPFWLLPGDLLIAGPILLLVSPSTLTRMAVTAGNGGVIPWQSGIATPIGRFQFVLGREVGVSWYGTKSPQEDTMLIPTSSTTSQLVRYSSTKFDFPILEFRPFRTFSLNQSSSLLVQLTGGFDIPFSPGVIVPVGEPAADLRTVWYAGVRIVFDWRKYF